MRFAITANYREFFAKNKYIELEGLLPLDQVAQLKKNAEDALAKRLQIPLHKLSQKTALEIFQAGYDLSRDSKELEKTTHKNTIAMVASELLETLPLRYGFDQYFSMSKTSAAPFTENYTLQETSCLDPLVGALLLPLDDFSAPLPFFPMPIRAGSGLFLSPHFPIPWKELFATPGLRFLVIGYAAEKTLFRPDTRDPHAVLLKKLGYIFNEWLRSSLHPIILRKNP